jgi:hypothetical protein
MCNGMGLSCRDAAGKYLKKEALIQKIRSAQGLQEQGLQRGGGAGPAQQQAQAANDDLDDDDEDEAPEPIQRAMGYDPAMNARDYLTRLRAFNDFYGYDNNNLPSEQDILLIPGDITIDEYYRSRINNIRRN